MLVIVLLEFEVQLRKMIFIELPGTDSVTMTLSFWVTVTVASELFEFDTATAYLKLTKSSCELFGRTVG